MDHQLMSWLWQNALGVIPIVILAALITRVFPMRAATRHAIWTGALIAFLIPPVFSNSSLPTLPTLDQLSTNQNASRQSIRLETEQAPAIIESTTPESDLVIPSYTLPQPAIEHIIGNPARTRYTRNHNASSSRPSPTTTERSNDLFGPSSGQYSPRPVRTQSQIEQELATTSTREASDSLRTETDEPVIASSTPQTLTPVVVDTSIWTRWKVYLLAIREAIVNMPPFPIALWLTGASLVMLVGTWRVIRFKWMLRSIEPAPAHIQSHVDTLAAQLDLPRAPKTVICSQRVTPMIYCGMRPILVLPTELWSQLDTPGRAAVIQHELAHLRRRDHWICWIESLVAVIYWWHPIAWWVRSRVRDEADLSCDAWVTALLPQYRKNYAEALVSTRKYISLPGRTPPSVGLGATRVRAKRFSRRLLMIMTTRSRPGLTLPGVALSLALLVGTSVTSPMWACPPDETEAEHREHQKDHAHEHEDSHDAQSTFESFMNKSGNESLSYEAQAALEQALNALEELDLDIDLDLEDLDETLHTLQRSLQELAERSAKMGKDAHKYVDQEALGKLSHALGRFYSTMAPEPVNNEPPRVDAAPRAPMAPNASTYGSGASADDCSAIVQIPYELFGDSEKTSSLITIFVRPDVPTLVSPGDNSIVIHGNAATQDAFATFLAGISSDEEYQQAYPLPEGKLEDVWNLMRLSDVPIFVSQGDGAIIVRGNALQQKAFADFISLVHPNGSTTTAPQADEAEARAFLEAQLSNEAEARQRAAERHQREAEAHQRHAETVQREAETRQRRSEAVQREAETRQRAAEARQHEAEAKQHTAEARARTRAEARGRAEQNECEDNDQARAMDDQGEEIRRQADRMRAAADRVMNRSQQNYNRQLNRLNASADKLREKAEAHQHKLQDRYEQHVHKMQSKAESYYASGEEYHAKAEQYRDEVDGLQDELEALSEEFEQLSDEEREQVAYRMDKVRATIEKYTSKASSYDEKASAKRAAAEELFESLQGVEEELEAQNEQLEAELEQALEELEAAADQLEAELEQAQAEAEALMEQAAELEEQADDSDDDDEDDDPVA